MIKKFEEYEKLDEGMGKDLAGLALYLLFIFNGIKGDVPKRFDKQYFENYAKTLNIANNSFIYQQVLQEAKRKVMSDPRLNNKGEIIKALDSVIVFYKKDDEFCNLLFRSVNTMRNTKTTASIINNKIMILSKDSRPDHMYHELMHLVYEFSNKDETIVKTFDFNRSPDKQALVFRSLTNNEYSITQTSPRDTAFVNYLKQPTEIYARVNQLKFYLFKNKFLKNPYEKIPPKLIYDLMYGKVFASLSENEKQNFMDQGFISLLLYVNLKKLETIN